MAPSDEIAPFVMKTYQMVNDSSSDNLIRWGKTGNSFIVLDSLHFSQSLLPAFFKHSNFSSFIRQLNTYGFRKVDPDRYEFANEWFLRGQVHLLKNIGRRRHNNSKMQMRCDDDEDDAIEIAMEIARVKQEQKELEKKMLGLNKRIEATERRPIQITALLCLVAEDPQILQRMMLKTEQKRLVDRERQRKLQTSTGMVSSVKCEENEEVIVESVADGSAFWWRSTLADTPSMSFPATKDLDVRPPPPYPLLGGGF